MSSNQTVYPRVCGGTAYIVGNSTLNQGLSPRVRGNPGVRWGSPMTGRSIPACAGEPPRTFMRLLAQGVYPRVCGGTGAGGATDCAAWGLSPRVRGNLYAGLFARRCKGSIPACAGEPTGGLECQADLSVYPRVCGGTWTSASSPFFAGGLSPRVRGNQPIQLP